MSKVVRKYCGKCRKETKQLKTNEGEEYGTVGRIFLAFAIVGFTELANDNSYECLKCGNVITVSKI